VTFSEHVATSNGVDIAVRDHGGWWSRRPGWARGSCHPTWPGRFAAYQRESARALNAGAAQTPILRLADVPTGHDVHLEAPGTVVRLTLGRDERGWTA
jgi:hypothetical protein